MIPLFILTLSAVLYLFFDRGSVYEYFPEDTAAALRVNDYKGALSLSSPALDSAGFADIGILKYIPSKDFYLVIDGGGKKYLFLKLSFLTTLLRPYGQVEKNVFCVTDNADFHLRRHDVAPEREALFKKLKGGGEGTFVISASGNHIRGVPFSDDIWGRFYTHSDDNTAEIRFHTPYRGEVPPRGRISDLYGSVPGDANLMFKMDLDGLESNYARLRNLISDTELFKAFLKSKKKIFEMTGIDIEKQAMPFLDKGFLGGAQNGRDYFIFSVSPLAGATLEHAEEELKRRYPIAFEELTYGGKTYKALKITGVAGLIARSVMGERMNSMKKPYYYRKDDGLFVFDNKRDMESFLRDTPFSKPRPRLDRVRENFFGEWHLGVYADSQFVKMVSDNQYVYDNISALSFCAVMNRDVLDGSVVIKLKRTYHHMEENL